MKKMFNIYLCLFLLAVPAYAHALSNWTILVYIDADNNLESDGIDDFLEMSATGSDENINYVVQMDRIDDYVDSYGDWTDCKRFHVQKGMTPTAENALEDLGEVNMGDINTLKDFIQWGMTNYPAQQYALVLWDHGDGWSRKRKRQSPIKGICFDDTSGYDAGISMLDLKDMLQSLTVKPVLVGFDACLMGMVENAYMLKLAGISVMVGSEETEPAPGWPYDTISQGLASNPQWQAPQLGKWIVEKYYESYDMEETQSAIDLTKIDPLIDSLSTLATSLRTSWQDNVEAIKNAVQTLQMRIDNAVIAAKNGNAYREAGGLAIYFPTSYMDSNYDQTDLAIDTPWNEFLSDFQDTMTSSWIGMARRQVLSFSDSDFIDLDHFCRCLEQYDPDDYKPGYTVNETDYAFEDIQETGSKEIIYDESYIDIIPDGFSFLYYDNAYHSFRICDNGIIYFSNTGEEPFWGWSENSYMPSDDTLSGAFIAPFWDDYNDATVFWEIKTDAAEKRLVVQWQDLNHYEHPESSAVTFQAVLYENGQIDFQYKDTEYNNESIDYGKSATVGIQGTPFSGVQYSYNEPNIQSPFGLSFIPEDESGCHYSLASYHQSVGPEGEIRSVSLQTEENCQWETSSQADWIHVISEKSGSGPAMIRFQVSENKSLKPRSGKLEIANRKLIIDQDSPCEFDISPLKQTVAASGGKQHITISTSLPDCPWSIECLAPWIIPLDSMTAGSGAFHYSVLKNPLMNKRTGEIDVNGTNVTVIQDAAEAPEVALLENHSTLKNLSLLLGERLYYKIEIPPDHYNFEITTSGGTGDCDIAVSYNQFPTDEICDHESSGFSNDERIVIPEPAAGEWYIMLYAYEHFQNLTFAVSFQSYQCEYTLSNTLFTFESTSSSGSFQLTADDSCTWHIDHFSSWIEIVNISNVYQGSAVIHFNLSENTSFVKRSAFIEVADQLITIIQSGNEDVDILKLQNGIPRTDLSGDEYSMQIYKIVIPENQEELVVETWGGSGDCDIYLQFSEIPDMENDLSYSDNYANDEKIVIQYPQAGEYFVLVYAYSDYDEVSIQAEYRSSQCTYSFSQTEINVDSTETTGQIEVITGDECSWQAVSLEDWISVISVSASMGSGTIDFTVSANETSMQRTGVIEIADTLIFIHQNSSLDVVEIWNNQPLTGISVLNNDALFFEINVPANQKNLMIDTYDGTGDVDLYAHYGRIPDDIIPDYECYAWGNDENLYIKNPDEGKWYIMIVGFEDSDNVCLKAAYSTLNCNYQITPIQTIVEASGGTGYLNIEVNEGCSWTAIKHGKWIEIDESTRRGSGSGYVRYTAAANESANIRTNNIRVADQWLAVVQSGTEQASPVVMTPNMPVTMLGDSGTLQYYQIDIEAETRVSFIMSGGSGDCDLYIRHGSFPTFRIYDFRPYNFGNDERVIIDNASAGKWYIMLHGASEFADVQLRIVYGNDAENLADCIRVLQVLVGLETEAADRNHNGKIDIGDALMVLGESFFSQ